MVGSTPVTEAIPSGFVGLSLRIPTFELYAGTDPGAVDPVFEQLVRNLATGQSPVLRFAGTDETWWPVPGMARPPGVTFTLTARYLQVVRAFAQAINARLILGVNFEADSTAVAGNEARALLGGIGGQSIGALRAGQPARALPCVRVVSAAGRAGRQWPPV